MNVVENKLPSGHLLARVFDSPFTQAWPDFFDVDVVAHERSPHWQERAAKRPARVGLRTWRGTARNVVDEKGVETLLSEASPRAMPLGERMSRAGAKADALADPKVVMGVHKRARLLRPVLFAVGALSAKVEKAGVIEARRKRAKAKAAPKVSVAA